MIFNTFDSVLIIIKSFSLVVRFHEINAHNPRAVSHVSFIQKFKNTEYSVSISIVSYVRRVLNTFAGSSVGSRICTSTHSACTIRASVFRQDVCPDTLSDSLVLACTRRGAHTIVKIISGASRPEFRRMRGFRASDEHLFGSGGLTVLKWQVRAGPGTRCRLPRL